ncbi:MAG: DUF1207 domain-containing protein [Planctomycetaceae bacterium]|nr:DUF1207 domain-containing protein [Planctomycetaceae bacterium]
MSTLRCRLAASAFVLASLWGSGEADAQTWVRPGDVIFDTFGDPPDIELEDESPHRTTQLAGGEFLPPDAPPALLPAAEPDQFINGTAPATAPFGYSTGSAAVSQNDEWHVLPGTLLYHSYLAGPKEPRIGLSVLNDSKRGWLWESALGGRVGILRRGDLGLRPANAWQIDLEGAALARVNPVEKSAPLEATDYRIGIQWTKRTGPLAYKAGYYHVSSHVGDEFLLLNPGFKRINYVRDSLVFGVTRDVTDDVQVYGEIGYALGADGGAEPLEFQFGTQYVPIADTGRRGSPFAAANVQMRQEVDFGGGINLMAGWRWRGVESGRLLRIGLQYYNGKSIQYEFYDESQQMFGYGIWLDY